MKQKVLTERDFDVGEEVRKNKVDMLSGPLVKNILIFAIPLAVTGILQQLFNAADVAVVGRFVGKDAMAAVGSNSPIVGLIVNLFVGISLGSNVVIAKLTGGKDIKNIKKAVDISILLAIVCGLVAAVVGEIAVTPVLKLIGVPQEVFSMASDYLRIYLIGLPVILLYNFESAIFRSQGDSVTPLICLTISGLVNVALNLFFVIVCKMTANGVALATVISNLVSSVILLWILTHSNRNISIHKHKIEIDKTILKRILVIGLPAGLQSTMFSISNICVQSAINGLGTDIMAASSAAFNIEIFVYYIINAYGQACTTFIGQNHGAGNTKRCNSVLVRSLEIDIVFTLLISVVILLAGEPLLRIFNTDLNVIQYGVVRLKVVLYSELINVIIEIFSGAMRGYGRSLEPALISLFGVCGVRIVWVFLIFPKNSTFSTLLWCYPISWCVTAVLMVIVYFASLKRLQKTDLKPDLIKLDN